MSKAGNRWLRECELWTVVSVLSPPLTKSRRRGRALCPNGPLPHLDRRRDMVRLQLGWCSEFVQMPALTYKDMTILETKTCFLMKAALMPLHLFILSSVVFVYSAFKPGKDDWTHGTIDNAETTFPNVHC